MTKDIAQLVSDFDLAGKACDDLVTAGRQISPLLDEVLERFYQNALTHPQIKSFFPNSAVVDHARQSQKRHWQLLFEGTFSDAYRASATRTGRTHYRLQLPFEHYLASYARATSHIQTLLITKTNRGFLSLSRRRIADMIGALTRAFELDKALVIEGYFMAEAEEAPKAFEYLTDGIRRMAMRDFSQFIPDPESSDYPKRYNDVREAFNNSLKVVRDTIVTIRDSVGELETTAGEVSQAASDLSHRTESQAATLEETAAAMEEITASQKSTVEATDTSNKLITEARKRAEVSEKIVEEAIRKMQDIETSSGKISQIISVIEDIAFQTNLLALNAGVEAARAGDAGRGFAVVASEVRNLAQMASNSAREIKELISSSSGQVKAGVKYVTETGDALKAMVGDISSVSVLIADISTSSREQAIGLSEINQGVSQLDTVTQQNAAMVEQTTAAMVSLKDNMNDLASLVGSFQTDRGGVTAFSSARSKTRHDAPLRAKVAGGAY